MTAAVDDREVRGGGTTGDDGGGGTTASTTTAPTAAERSNSDKSAPSSPSTQRGGELHRCVALYKFVAIPADDDDPDRRLISSLRDEIEALCLACRARGCLILAPEGINGTVCLPAGEECDEFLDAMRSHRYFGDVDDDRNGGGDGDDAGAAADSSAMRLRLRVGPPSTGQVFARLKVKVKSEIVTMGPICGDGDSCGGDRVRCSIDTVGTYVPPSEWNDVLTDPDVLVIDTRNDYEVDIGTFEHAVRPDITCFRQFPSWLEGYLQRSEDAEGWPRPRKCAMFCTGGIRCEKATSFANTHGLFDEVYHLEGGILAYLDQYADDNIAPPGGHGRSLWRGECFVFDGRVSVGEGLRPTGTYAKCLACRRLLSTGERDDADFVEGVSCRYCVGTSTEEQRRRHAERQLQVELAERQGGRHMFDPKSDGLDCGGSAPHAGLAGARRRGDGAGGEVLGLG